MESHDKNLSKCNLKKLEKALLTVWPQQTRDSGPPKPAELVPQQLH